MKFPLKRLARKQAKFFIPRVHIKYRNGQLEIMGLGAWYSYWRDPYHLLLTIPWTGFVLLIWASYVIVNTFFALLYLAGGDCIANAQPGSFLDAFFFSVQTIASIGYGAMYPKTIYANFIVMSEAMIGIMGIAVMTGLAFARFSKATARIIFSRFAVVTEYEGLPTLIFRSANQRRNMILEAQMRVYLMRDEVTAQGEFMRRIHDLKLLRNQTPSFTLSWSAIHTIDESSPLYGMTSESLKQTNSMVIVSVNGIDETVSQVVHARHSYGSDDIVWNHRFVDIFHYTTDGHRYIDYKHFHDIEPLEHSKK